MFDTVAYAPHDHRGEDRGEVRALHASPTATVSTDGGSTLVGSAAEILAWAKSLGEATAANDPAAAIDRISALQSMIHRCEGALVDQ